jgi:hypothetical protein
MTGGWPARRPACVFTTHTAPRPRAGLPVRRVVMLGDHALRGQVVGQGAACGGPDRGQRQPRR